MHHIVCIFVAIGAMHPFLHLYGIFYFGISEISTALVSGLACFDEQHGVPELGQYFPKCKVAIGVSFATLFVLIRALIWPYLAHYVTQDCLSILADGSAHSPTVVYAFLGCLCALTLLQFVWLFEIARRAPAEIREALAIDTRKKA